MGRHKSAITVRGRKQGFDYTERDHQRLRFIARWYCISPMHLVRQEEDDWALWHPRVHLDQGNPEARNLQLRNRINGIRDRMRLMSRVTVHPPVGILQVAAHAIGYYATRTGGKMVSPWGDLSTASWQNYAHAFMAADIGMHLERAGFQVYSEREVRTGHAVTGDIIKHDLASNFRYGQGGRTIQKLPDLVVPSQCSLDYIAVEIERDENRPLSVYRDKLQAYLANPNITKVWYCYPEGTNTGHRVLVAAQQLFGASWDKHLRLIPCIDRGGFYEMGASDEESNISLLDAVLNDLAALESTR
jgi:hypothetical protein